MRYSTALVAGIAATASAFLIPPSFPNDIVKDTRFQKDHKDKTLVHALLAEKTEVLNLDCPGCPYAVAHTEDRDAGPATAGITWEYDVENSLHLEFDAHDHSIQVNGHPIYPFEAALKARSTLVKASQIRKDTHERSVDFPLNFAADVGAPIRSSDNDDLELIGIEFTILGLNGILVKIPSIFIHLVKTPDDEFVITKLNTIPFLKTPGAKTCESTSSGSLCRINAILSAHVSRIMDMAKEKSQRMQDWFQNKPKGCPMGKKPNSVGLPLPPPHHDHPHRHGKPGHHDGGRSGHHKHHSKHHRFAHMLRQAFRFFIIPATLGIIGGLVTCAVGFLFGQAIVHVYVALCRIGRRGPREEIIFIEEEKEELLGESDESLPQYSDVVTVVDVVESVTVQDKKSEV